MLVNDLISKREILAIIFRHIWSGLAVFFSCIFAAAFLVFYLISPAYQSDAVIIINSSFLTYPLRDAPPDSDLEKTVAFHTQRDIIESTRLATEVVKATNLAETRVIDRMERIGMFIDDIKRVLGRWFGIERWTTPWDPEAAAIAAVDEWVETFAIPDSKALLVTFRAKSPEEAAMVLTSLLDIFSEYYYQEIRQKAAGVESFLEDEYETTMASLAAAEEALLLFKKNDRLDITAIAEETGLNADDLPSFAGITDSAQIQDELKLYVLKLEEELRLTNQIEDNQTRQKRQRDLRKRIDVYLEVINSLPERELTYVRLQREYDKHQSDYVLLERNLTRARIVAEGETEDMGLVDVFEKPLVNKKPVFPRKKMILVMAAVFGAILSLTWIFLIDYFDHTIRSARDVRGHLGLQMLGSIRKLR